MPTSSPVALVTGSGKRRLGRAVADALAERGYRLVIHYHTSAADAADLVAGYRQRGLSALAFQADLTKEQDAQGLIHGALEHFGRLDVLVNCAAIWRTKRLEDVTAADLRAHFDANVLSTFLCSQQAGLAMV